MLITVSSPIMLLPAVETNIEKVLFGGIKVDKKAEENRKSGFHLHGEASGGYQ